MEPPYKKIPIISVLQPEMCKECRFAIITAAPDEQGKTQQIVFCRRKDCDNWQNPSASPSSGPQKEGE